MTTWVPPRAWNNELITDAKLNEISTDLTVIGQKPPTYTPTVTAGWTSNVTVAGTARMIDKFVFYTITATFSGTPAGSGGVLISLPSTPSADFASWVAIGAATARDISTTGTTGGTAVWGATVGGVPCVSAYFGATRLANAAPYTFAAGDYVQLQGWYYTD